MSKYPSNGNFWSNEARYGQDATGGLGDGMRDINAAQVAALLKTENSFAPNFGTAAEEAYAIAIDDSGNTYLSEEPVLPSTAGSISKYNTSGVRQWSVAPSVRVPGGDVSIAADITYDSTNDYIVAVLQTGVAGGLWSAIERLDPSDGAEVDVEWATLWSTTDDLFFRPYAIAHIHATSDFWILASKFTDTFPAVTSSPRLMKWRYSSGWTKLSDYGSDGSGDGQFAETDQINNPLHGAISLMKGIAMQNQRSVVVGTDGNDYECTESHVASVATRPITGANYATVWLATGGSGAGATWTNSENYFAKGIHVCDSGNNRIQEFDASGVYVRKASVEDVTTGIAVDATGRIYVRHSENPGTQNVISVFSSTYALIGTRIGSREQGIGGAGNEEYLIDFNPSGEGVVYDTDTIYQVLNYEENQTVFSKYTRSDTKLSLGTPDGGVSIPAAAALDPGFVAALSASVAADHIIDMRAAIEVLAIDYAPDADSGSYDWVGLSASNLYLVALGDRDTGGNDFGFSSPSPADDWERTQAQMEASSVVVGTDGNDYVCIVAHTSTADNKPITGGDYADVWEATGGSGAGAAWALSTVYSTNATYDIDIGEVQLCAAALTTPYTFGES